MKKRANVLGLHHPAIVVPDLSAAIQFYSEFAGYRLSVSNAWDADSKVNQIMGLSGTAGSFAVLKGAYGYLELFEFDDPPFRASVEVSTASDPGIRHLCFQVLDVAEALVHLQSLGGIKMNDPVTNERGVTSVYARDPFGNLIELLSTGGVIDGLEEL